MFQSSGRQTSATAPNLEPVANSESLNKIMPLINVKPEIEAGHAKTKNQHVDPALSIFGHMRLEFNRKTFYTAWFAIRAGSLVFRS